MRHLRSATRSVWARALVSLGLLGLVLSQLELGELRAVLAKGRWDLFAAAVGVLLFAFVVGAIRWRMLLTAAGVPVSMLAAQRSYFAGVFASSFLLGAMAGDVARVLLVGGAGTRARSAATVLFDRFTIFAAAAALGWVAVYPANPPRSLIAALGLATVLLAFGAILVALSVGGAVRLRRYVPFSLRGAGREGFLALRGSLTPRVLAGPVAGLGLAYEALAVLSVWLLARCLGIDVSLWTIAVVAPPILILSALPISIGGLGVREASFVGLLGEVGVSAPEATLLGLLAGASFLLAALPGAFALVRGHDAGRHETAAAQAGGPGPSRLRLP